MRACNTDSCPSLVTWEIDPPQNAAIRSSILVEAVATPPMLLV